MLLAGETMLRERLGAVAFLVFWLACFVFACLAMLVALLDVSAIRRRSREEQRTLFESTLQEIARQKEAKRRFPLSSAPFRFLRGVVSCCVRYIPAIFQPRGGLPELH